MNYQPALDGIRGLAILLVIVRHTGHDFAESSGIVGVTLFFVLSGYLITRILLDEHKRTGAIALRAFWWRRALRLLPALIFVVLIVAPLISIGGGDGGRAAASVLGYVANWAAIAGLDLGPLGMTWSLAVEEQFYLVWPLMLTFLIGLGKRPARIICCALIAVSAIERPLLAMAGASEIRLQTGTDLYVGSLMVGAMLAMVKLPRMPEWVGPVAVGSLLILSLPDLEFYLGGGALIVNILSALVLVCALGDGRTKRAFSSQPLVATGRISYGLYLVHYPLTWVTVPLLPLAIGVPALYIISFAIAWLMYRTIEAPFLRLKRSVTTERPEVPSIAPAVPGG